MRSWWRRPLAYVLCALIFGGGVLLTIRLSVPPQPSDRHERLHTPVEDPLIYSVDGDVLAVESEEGRRRYRLHQDGEEFTVVEIEE